jgi:hypothetical protein
VDSYRVDQVLVSRLDAPGSAMDTAAAGNAFRPR